MKKILTLIFPLFFGLSLTNVSAQDSHTTNTDREWYKPDHFVVQYAGNIGLFSAGPGYSYFNDRVNTEIMYGIVPGFEAKTSIHL
jgi:hypothetical protein